MAQLRPGHRIFVAGHRGLVGSALVRALQEAGYDDIVTVTREELDLRCFNRVAAFLESTRPHCVFLAAAKVGGIAANARYPVEFLTDNVAIQQSVLLGALRAGVGRLVFLGSSCVYPKLAPQPIAERELLSGPLEPTNGAYAIAKIAGIELVEALRHQHRCDYFSVMPTNLYGPGDNYDTARSHVVPALVRRFHEAKERGDGEVVVWGSGTPRREMMYSLDAARALVLLAERYPEPEEGNPGDRALVNVGVGEDLPIAKIAERVRATVGLRATLRFDRSFPDGTPRKLLDTSRLRALGFAPRVSFEEGLRLTYKDALARRVFDSGREGASVPRPTFELPGGERDLVRVRERLADSVVEKDEAVRP